MLLSKAGELFYSKYKIIEFILTKTKNEKGEK